MTTPDAKSKADALLEKLLKGKEIHDLFAGNMRRHLLINNKTIDQWEDRFKIHIKTDDLTPQVCKQIDLLLMELHQEASFYFAVASAKVQMIKRGGDSTYRDRFFAITEDYRSRGVKLPAAATLETLAKVENDDLESAQAIAEIEKGFWSDILNHLSTCRKLVENATFNSSVEAKMFLQANSNGGK